MNVPATPSVVSNDQETLLSGSGMRSSQRNVAFDDGAPGGET
jgi:hypothetical protein